MNSILNPRNLILFQGVYYFVTGVWPLIDIDSFMAVTGPKYDIWLVKTVGMLITVISLCLLTAGAKRLVDQPVIMLSAGAALGFIGIDVIYVYLNVISSIYLVDALAELIILIIWCSIYIRYKKDKNLVE